MRKKNYKGRCEKRVLSKSKEVCRLYDAIQSKYADILQEDKSIEEIRCNVQLESLPEGEFTSDFLCVKKNGEYRLEVHHINSVDREKDIEGINYASSWIWVSGNTYGCKSDLKANGFQWASKKKMWYWHDPEEQARSNGKTSMDDIRSKYGSETIKKAVTKMCISA